MDNESVDERVKRLQERTLAEVRRLRPLELSMLETEVLDHLLRGRRTGVELVDHIYGLHRGDPDFNASHLKIRRSLRNLEDRGIVSTNLFGREKPYHITRHGISVLASIAPETEPPRIIRVQEISIVGATTICGVVMLIYSRGVLGKPELVPVLFAFALFFTLFGMSIMILGRLARRVF
jgi:hypothetical protein